MFYVIEEIKIDTSSIYGESHIIRTRTVRCWDTESDAKADAFYLSTQGRYARRFFCVSTAPVDMKEYH